MNNLNKDTERIALAIFYSAVLDPCNDKRTYVIRDCKLNRYISNLSKILHYLTLKVLFPESDIDLGFQSSQSMFTAADSPKAGDVHRTICVTTGRNA